MKNLLILLILSSLFIAFACKKDNPSQAFVLLTTPVWSPDSLLAFGIDAGSPGGFLESFNSDAKFNKDGTGVFGNYTGTWRLTQKDTELVISSDSLAIRTLTTKIAELTEQSLKITTAIPNEMNLSSPIPIRMTFKAK